LHHLALGLLALTVPLLAGCAELEPKPNHPYLPPGDVAARHIAWERSVRTLEGEARVEIDSPRREGSLKGSILVKKPHRFRMVAYPPVGGTIFDITVVRDRLRFHLPRENRLIDQTLGAEGPVSAKEGLADLNQIFARSGLTGLILGGGEESAQRRLELLDRDEQLIRFGVFNEDGLKTEEVHILEGTLFKARHLTFGRGGKIVLDVSYADYQKSGEEGIWWPHEIRIACPGQKFRLVLDFNDVVLNTLIPNASFEIDVPAGTEIVKE
jgi:hypothetical protein